MSAGQKGRADELVCRDCGMPKDTATALCDTFVRSDELGGVTPKQPSPTPASEDDRFRKDPPVIELTDEVISNLQRLLDDVQQVASITGLPWRGGANAGKPLLYAGAEKRGALIAYGTIGSWNEIDLAIAAVNALPAFLESHRQQASASVAALKSALEPFALDIRPEVPDDFVIETVAWTAGQHRAARLAIKGADHG